MRAARTKGSLAESLVDKLSNNIGEKANEGCVEWFIQPRDTSYCFLKEFWRFLM